MLGILGVVLVTGSAWAWPDLCETAKDTPALTSAALNEFYREKMAGQKFEGRAQVRDVRQITQTLFDFLLDCGNDVLVEVTASPIHEAQFLRIKRGEWVRFVGSPKDFVQKHYQDAPRMYVVIVLGDGDVR
jgi:hypothetical protein